MKSFKEYLTEQKNNFNIIIVTGPLATGKTTYKNSIADVKNGIIPAPEYQDGMDISKPNWWVGAVDEAINDIPKKDLKKIKTLILESHFRYGYTDAFDGKELGKIKKQAKNIKVHVVLPNKKRLIKQQMTRDSVVDEDSIDSEIAWYQSVIKQLKAKHIK